MKTKRFLLIFCPVALFLCAAGAPSLSASTYTYDYAYTTNQYLNLPQSSPYWVEMPLPDSTTGTYNPSSFEYNPANVTSFTITLHGTGFYPGLPINIYLDYDSNHSSYTSVLASYTPPNTVPFSYTLNLMASPAVNLSSFDPGSDPDTFYIGYACHFTLTGSDVHIEQRDSTVPEPATMLLLGSGLIGLWGARRKFKK